jgi:hypothetical protein
MGQKQLINFLGLTWSSGPRNLMETPRNPLSVSAYHCAAFPINSLGPQKPSTCPLALSVQLHILIKTCLFVIPLRRQLWMHRGKNLRMPVSDGTVRHCPPHENIDQLANYANFFFWGGLLCLISCSTPHLLFCGNIFWGHVVNFSHEKTWVLLGMYLYALIISDTWRYLCISWNGSSMVMVPDHSSKSQFGS